jgi:hypothetical protein
MTQETDLPNLSSPAAKNISLFDLVETTIEHLPSRTHQEGRYASVTNVERGMRWTLMAPQDERCVRGRRSRVVLTPRRWCQVGDDALHRADDGGKKARFTGESAE